jgi:hypothetical protein
MPAYVLPIATFGDLVAFDLEAAVSCRCGRQTILDPTSAALRDRPIGHSRFRCSTHLPDNRTCGQVHVATLRKRGRAGWTLADHWRAMMDRNPETDEPGRIRTFRDHVHAGNIAWLSDTGCHPGGFTLQMVAFDEPPFDRWLDRPVGPIVCPTCRKALSVQTTHGNSTRGGLQARARLSAGGTG